MKKQYVLRVCLLAFLLIIIQLVVVLKIVNYNLFEYKLSVKAILGQELTVEEMSSSSIYKTYNQIDYDTKVEEIDNILNKKSKNIYKSFESWYYPFGYLSIFYGGNDEPRVLTKVVMFKTPYTTKLSEEGLYSVFECNSIKNIISLLGEPAILGESYDKNGEVSEKSYEWGIRTSYSEVFVEDIGKKYNDHVSLSSSNHGKLRLSVTIGADDRIEKVSLFDSKNRFR